MRGKQEDGSHLFRTNGSFGAVGWSPPPSLSIPSPLAARMIPLKPEEIHKFGAAGHQRTMTIRERGDDSLDAGCWCGPELCAVCGRCEAVGCV